MPPSMLLWSSQLASLQQVMRAIILRLLSWFNVSTIKLLSSCVLHSSTPGTNFYAIYTKFKKESSGMEGMYASYGRGFKKGD